MSSETLIGASEPVAAEIQRPPGTSDRSLAGSVAWNAAGDWASQIFSWLSFLIVMRLLSPGDFGIAAMAVLLAPYLGQLTSFGIPRAVVTLRDLTDDQLAQLNTVSFFLGLAMFTLAALLAKPFALFMRTPRLTPIVIVACAALIPQGLQGVSTGSLMKQMRFRLLSIIGLVTALVAAVATLAMALLGFGYWSLVLGNLMSGIVRTALLLRARPCRLAWPHLDSLRVPLKFGGHVTVSMLALNSYQRLDNLVAGRALGQVALGFYGMAWELANVPIEKVTSLVTTVIPSYMAAVQDQPAELRRYLRGLTEAIALITLPATVGLALVAREMVPVFFGHKWDGMIAPLEVLSFYAAVRSVVALLPKVLTAVGNVRYVMWNDLTALIILPVAFYLGSYRGTAGIAWAWVIAYPFVALPLYRKTFKTISMTTSEYLQAVRPALEGTIVMILAVKLVRYFGTPMRSLLLQLVVEVTIGGLAYLGTLRVRHGERMSVLIDAARRFRSAKAHTAASYR
jgi:teichuronic acid exporter